MQIGRMADGLGEMLEHANRFDRQPDIGFVRELMPDAAGVAPGRSGAELRFALEQHDVGDAELRQMPGDARAHASAADDDDVRRTFHVCYQRILTAPDSRMALSRVISGSRRSCAVATIERVERIARESQLVGEQHLRGRQYRAAGTPGC